MIRIKKGWLIGIIISILFIQKYSEIAFAQTAGFEVGDEVVVITTGSNLNLREDAGLSFPIVARLPNDTVMEVIGGPESADGYQWWEIEGTMGRGWAAGNFLMPISGVSIQTGETSEIGEQFDWRRDLVCPPSREIYQGMEYCEGLDDTNHQVHVLVIDLHSAGIAIEYIIPKGYSNGHQGLLPCRDPNVPAWAGPAGGCYVYGYPSKYPTINVHEAANRAVEVRTSPQLAAIINADYGASNETHGPEGLFVIQRERLDGADKCDDDYNAALRPWFGVGDGIDPSTGLLTAAIDRLEMDSSSLPEWLYTGIGGGPWLVQNGLPVPGSSSCIGNKELDVLEPIENCTGNEKDAKPVPLLERYAGGSCRSAPHTAVGISKDNRWLFFVISTSERDPDTITKFMQEKLGVWNAMKFDGGGSSQMLFMGSPEILIYPQNINRKLTNYLALYAPEGEGITLPLEAEPKERIYYSVVIEGETSQVQIEILNSGAFTWSPEDNIELREEPWSLLSPVIESLPLPGLIAPSQTANWDWEINTNGVLVQRFQMYQKNETFGPEIAVVVVVIPKDMADKKDEIERKIQEMIDEWKARGEQQIEELVKQITEWALREISKKFNEICNCNGIFSGIGFLAMVWFFNSFQKHNYRRK